jgi:hypothetical protein
MKMRTFALRLHPSRSLSALYTLLATYLIDASNFNSMKWRYLIFLFGGAALVGLGISFLNMEAETRQAPSSSIETRRISSSLSTTSCAIVLIPHQGDEEIDREIRKLQDEARSNPQRTPIMTRLGWAFIITKARLSYDPGYYKLGEQCALFLRSKSEDDPDALLAGRPYFAEAASVQGRNPSRISC